MNTPTIHTLRHPSSTSSTSALRRPRSDRGLFAFAFATLALLSSCGGGGGGGHSSAPQPPASLVSIEVTPTNASLAQGTTQAFTAIGTFSDVTTQDLTGQVAWSSSDPAVAGISDLAGSKGFTTALAAGTTTIEASLSGIVGTTTLFVTNATLVSIEVTPTNPSIALGTTQAFVATGTFSDVTTQDLTAQVVWDSSDAAVATVSNVAGESGLALAAGVGNASVSATFGGIVGSTTLTVTNAVLVSMEVTPTDPSIVSGTQQAFVATGIFDDATAQDLTTQAAWASSNPAVALVSNAAGSHGIASAVAAGNASVSAELFGVSGSTTLTVTSAALVAIDVTPTDFSTALGTTQQFVATGIFADGSSQDLTQQATWSSADKAVATLSNAAGSQGLATTIAVGSTLVSAELSGISGSTTLTVTGAALVSIEVSPDDAQVALGTAQQFVATGIYTDDSAQDLTLQVTWASADPAVAAISNAAGSQGFATSVGVGATTISATLSSIVGSTPFGVTSATLASIDITPFQPAIASGTQVQFDATGTYSDGSTQDLTAQVTWASSNGLVALVSNAAGSHGLCSGVGVGSATISASLDGLSDATDIQVTSAVLLSLVVTPADQQIPKGMAQQLAAVGTFSDGATQDLTGEVTWTSSNGAVAAVSNAAGSRGLAVGTGFGVATISALHSGIAGATTLTVTNAVLGSITVAPGFSSVPHGFSVRYTATGNYSDGSTLDLSKQALWTSTAPLVSKISNAAGSDGVAKAMSVGVTTISANFGGISGTTTLTVTNESLSSIAVSPAPVSLDVGEQQQMIALGTFSGGSVYDITDQVRWSSNAKSVATVNNAAHMGLVTAKHSGSATIKAKKGAKQGTAVVNVP